MSLSGEAQKSPIRPPLRLHPDAAAGPLSGTFSPSDGLREGGKEMEHGGTPRSYSHSSRLPCQKRIFPSHSLRIQSEAITLAVVGEAVFAKKCSGLAGPRGSFEFCVWTGMSRGDYADSAAHSFPELGGRETGCQIKKRRKGESQELKERGYIVLEENVLQVLEYIHHSRLRRRNRSEDEILSSHLPYFVLNEQNRGRRRRRALTKSAMAMNSTLIPRRRPSSFCNFG